MSDQLLDNVQSTEPSNHDLEIRIDAKLGKTLLDALEFPLHLELPEGELDEVDLDISDDFSSELNKEEHDEGIAAIVEDVLVQPLADHLEKAFAENKNETPEKRYRVLVRSLSITVPRAPDLAIGNPVELHNIALNVKAQLKIGVRFLGKWRWQETTTPWLTMEGRKAVLKLEALDSQLLVVPELQDTGVVISLNIWKWPLKCRLGLSKWINRQLLRRGPFKVVDFADFHLGTEMLGKKPHFKIGSVCNTEGHLKITADVTWA
jgi:hypothetical protein